MEGDIVPGHGSDQHDPPLLGQDRYASGEIGTAYQVEDDVKAAAACLQFCELFQLTESRVDDTSGFQSILFCAADLVLRARSSVGNSAEGASDLHGGDPHSASHGMD